VELRHLRYFAAVAESCHFGKAAQRLHLAQPALSQAIRQLEAELEVTLLNRTTRQVSLTPAGEFLFAEVTRLLAALDDSVTGVRRIAAGRHGLLRFGLTGTAVHSHLPIIARALRRDLPAIVLETHAGLLTSTQYEALRTGSLDLCLLRPPAVGDDVCVRIVDDEPLVLALPADHPLAPASRISVNDLRNEAFVMYTARCSTVNEAVNRACREAGFLPRRAYEAEGTAVLLAFVAAGFGVALAPAGARTMPVAGVVFRAIVGAGSVELGLAWRTDSDNPVVDAARHVIEAELGTARATR
jgi:DNA-binding transcriptional LysR family regulator